MNIPIKLHISFKEEKAKKSKWRIFWLAFIPIFIIVFLQKLGVQVPNLAPLGNSFRQAVISKPNNSSSITPKLNLYPMNYKLKNNNSIFTDSYASGYYDALSAYVVVDYDSGQILAQKNLSQKNSIASLTKLMTAVIALDLAKSAKDLTLGEASFLVTLLQSPSNYSPFNGNIKKGLERQHFILQEMEKQHYITKRQRKAAENENLLIH